MLLRRAHHRDGFLPIFYALLATALIVCAFMVYGSHHYYHDPNGMFFDASRAFERRYSQTRILQALSYVESRVHRESAQERIEAEKENAVNQTSAGHTGDNDICAVVVSFGDARDQTSRHLEVTIGSLLDRLSPPERAQLILNVYIANTDPRSHPLIDSGALKLADGIVSARDVAQPELFAKLVNLEENQSYEEKTALDFSLALDFCLQNSTAPHIALFEDDIVAADSWFVRSQLALDEARHLSSAQNQQWLDLRLFTDSKQLFWGKYKFGLLHLPVLFIHLPVSVLLLSGISYMLLVQLRRHQTLRTYLPVPAIRVFCITATPLLAILFVNFGMLSVSTIKPGLSVQPWGCCTQGEIFPRAQLPSLIAVLRERSKESPADLTIRDYANERQLHGLVLNPPMVQHLGFSSILNPDRSARDTVWSLAFEDLKQIELRDQHIDMVRQYYNRSMPGR